ncbi:MAG: transcription termination factor Rho [Mycobacterium sp.]|nr:transcription termination factor Rho [Mycobacterium sp.]
MTDTDLITAGGSSEDVALPDPVNSDLTEQVSPAPSDEPAVAPPTAAAPVSDVAAGGSRGGSLTAMVLPDLRALANEVGVKGASAMRKSELIAAIRVQRGETNGTPAAPAADAVSADAAAPAEQAADGNAAPPRARRERRGASRQAGAPDGAADSGEKADGKAETPDPADKADAPAKTDKTEERGAQQATQESGRQNRSGEQGEKNNGGNANSGGNANNRNSGGNSNNANNRNSGGNNNGGNNSNDDDDDDGDGRQGRRGRRFRDRRRRGDRVGGEGGGGGDTELREDDVVQPVAGILDVLDNYAFVRTSGYLAGPNDVYVSMNMVRKNGLRRGDAVTGAVRVAREGEGGGGGGGGGSQNPRQKFNPLVRLDTVNGGRVEDAKNRPDFTKLTPLYPNQRLRLETTPERLTTRIIDLIMPIGKGQRALIVSPPKAGKTTILQDIANAITVNNPECHLMVVLVDERPEEVTDMQRSVKGEVIASTFDRPPSDHTQAAELAIERAKRLVEQGKDVVVLLDSITRLGRAYNNASPASGRILSGGVDSTALYPPKRFLGAARNIEFGGSLTIIATAMVETGSTGDTVIFEEFKGTGNAELKLDRKISERRVFPAVDVNPSGTRKDELLLSTDEFGVVHKLRRVLSGLDPHAAIDLLMSQLRKTKTNYEFLMQVSKTTPGNMDHD